jgi:hypothetical protein
MHMLTSSEKMIAMVILSVSLLFVSRWIVLRHQTREALGRVDDELIRRESALVYERAGAFLKDLNDSILGTSNSLDFALLRNITYPGREDINALIKSLPIRDVLEAHKKMSETLRDAYTNLLTFLIKTYKAHTKDSKVNLPPDADKVTGKTVYAFGQTLSDEYFKNYVPQLTKMRSPLISLQAKVTPVLIKNQSDDLANQLNNLCKSANEYVLSMANRRASTTWMRLSADAILAVTITIILPDGSEISRPLILSEDLFKKLSQLVNEGLSLLNGEIQSLTEFITGPTGLA